MNPHPSKLAVEPEGALYRGEVDLAITLVQSVYSRARP
jgi:hypothetical protein